jgi:hypothetical protein
MQMSERGGSEGSVGADRSEDADAAGVDGAASDVDGAWASPSVALADLLMFNQGKANDTPAERRNSRRRSGMLVSLSFR